MLRLRLEGVLRPRVDILDFGRVRAGDHGVAQPLEIGRGRMGDDEQAFRHVAEFPLPAGGERARVRGLARLRKRAYVHLGRG